MKPLEVWTCQRAENLKKSLKIPKNNYAATMVSAARRQIIGGGGSAPINKSRRRRPQIVGGGAGAPAPGSSRMIGKRPRGRKRLGMLNEFLKESSYAELKRNCRKEERVENMEAKNLPHGRTQ